MNTLPELDERSSYLRGPNGEIWGLFEIGEKDSHWQQINLDGSVEDKTGFRAYERWGNEYDAQMKMIGRGSFRIHTDIDEVAEDLIKEGWVKFQPKI